MDSTFFATIAGALVAFLGVLVTLRATQRNFEANLNEEREKAREERTFQAKHKALLSATDSVSSFLNYYLTLADRVMPSDGTAPVEVSEMTVSLNRLHFYCGADTIRESTRMSEILSTSFARALQAKMPSMFIAQDVKALDVRIASLESMNERYFQEIIALMGADSSNPLLIDHKRLLATNFTKIAELQSKKIELNKVGYQAVEACRDVITQDLKNVYEAVRSVLLLAREELDFPIDAAEYTAILTGSTEAALTEMDIVIKSIRAEIAKRMQ